MEPKPRKRTLYAQSAAAFRWVHIYISMLSFAALMFFAFTGITLNHPTWFGADEQAVRDLEDTLPTQLLTGSGRTEDEGEVDKLAIAEHLRQRHQLRGYVAEFQVSEYDYMIVFKSPGYAADIIVDPETGAYTLTETVSSTLAVLNDLHKGRDSGKAWSWVIDVSAVVTMLVSLSGFGLLFYLKRRRRSGVITAVLGTALLVAIWAYLVP